MHLSKLSLTNFRLFSSQQFEFFYPSTFISGLNGAGKTSILEAIYYTCQSSSFRTGKRDDLIKFGESVANIKLEFDNQDVITIGLSADKKIIKINNEEVSSHKEIQSKINLFTLMQKDIEIIGGYPDARRLFFNQILSYSNPNMIKEFHRLNAILIHRKKLLENAMPSMPDLEIWTTKLVQVSQILQTNYSNLLQEMNEQLKKLKINIFIKMVGQDFQKNDFEIKTSNKELIQKRNLIGIQLSDFLITLNGKDTRRFSSRGEQKIAIFFLKLATFQLNHKKNKPIFNLLLCDDFFSEMDQKRENYMKDLLLQLPIQKIFAHPSNNQSIILSNIQN